MTSDDVPHPLMTSDERRWPPHQVKKRVGSKASGGFLFLDRPIFDVNVELAIPNISCSPPLEDFQTAINRAARAIMGVARHLTVWATDEDKTRHAALSLSFSEFL